MIWSELGYFYTIISLTQSHGNSARSDTWCYLWQNYLNKIVARLWNRCIDLVLLKYFVPQVLGLVHTSPHSALSRRILKSCFCEPIENKWAGLLTPLPIKKKKKGGVPAPDWCDRKVFALPSGLGWVWIGRVWSAIMATLIRQHRSGIWSQSQLSLSER